MDEKSQNDIIKILTDVNRFDLVSIMMSLFEEIDSDYDYESPDEPVEEFFERNAVSENIDTGQTSDGFFYIK